MIFARVNAFDKLSKRPQHWTMLGPYRDVPMSAETHDSRLDALVLDLVEWVAHQQRTYAEVMEAWRPSCPRLPVWEEAVDRGYLVSEAISQAGVCVRATPAGRRFLQAKGRLQQ